MQKTMSAPPVVWDVSTGQIQSRVASANSVRSLAISPNGTRFVSASCDRTVRLWESATGKCLRIFVGHTDVIYSAAFHPGGTLIASAGRDRTVWLWDVAVHQEVARLPGHGSYVWSLAFSPTGRR